MTEKEWQEILDDMEHDDSKASRRYHAHNFSMEWIENLSVKNDPELDELKDLIEKAMMKLTWKQRRVMKLIYFHGYTQNETAKIMGCKKSEVSRLKKRAINTLKKELKL